MANKVVQLIIGARDDASPVFEGLKTKLTGVAAAIGGAFAADKLVDFVRELAPVADAAANLEARVGLAVGEMGNLDAAMADVRASANGTGTDINAVGNLFAALSSSTRDLGKSQADVAGLTDLINKSMAVSGSTAGAAAGALTQLGQAFASGALRGDEFNSVSEASPRLMQALADGLGVTRGELRKMAEEGKLTSEVIFNALQSQADVINTEFGKMPETVGRATQRLANEWQVFVGEMDKSVGASELVASGLGTIAENLDSIASAAETAGEVVVAALAVKAAAALRGYVAQITVSTAATTAQAAALNGLAVAGRAATGALLTLGRALPGLAVAGVITGVVALVTEFFRAKSAAEDADEAVRKMLEATPTNNAAKAVELVATQAEAARFKLSETELAFGALQAKGQDAASALDSIVKTADLASADGITALITGLDQLRVGAQVTGEQIELALAQRLRRLSAADLRDFGIQAEMAFNRGALSAQQLGIALDSQARAALQRLGVDADAALTGMSAKFREADSAVQIVAGQFERLQGAGVEAGTVLQQSIDGAIKAASNRTELDTLAAAVRRLGEEGKLSEAAVVAALEAIRKKADEATPGINSVTEAFRELGIVSDATLKDSANKARAAFDQIRSSGTASARELQQAFRTYAERAIAANGGVASEAVKAQAAMYGLRLEADETGKSIVRGMNEAKGGTDDLGQSAADAAEQYRILGGVIGGLPSPPPPPGGGGTSGQGGGTGSVSWRNADGSLKDDNGGGAARRLDWGQEATLSRAERLGGLELRKKIEREWSSLRNGQAVPYEEFMKAMSRTIGQLDKLQIQQERESKRFSANEPRTVGPVQQDPPRTETFRVEIGTGAGRLTTINTASRADAEALTRLLQQLEADMSRAS